MMVAAAHTTSTLAQQRVEVIAVAVAICAVIFELVRRKRLMERYALLWLATGGTLLVLALWKGLLTKLAHTAGVHYLPSALFAVAFLFVLVMLVHSSMTNSRLSDQSKVLAQRLALMQRELDRLGNRVDSVVAPDGARSPASATGRSAATGVPVRLLRGASPSPQLIAEGRELGRRAS